MRLVTKKNISIAGLLLFLAAIVATNWSADAQSGKTFSGPVYFKNAKVTLDNDSSFTNLGTSSVTGNIEIESGSNLSIESGGDLELESGGDFNVQSGGDIEVESGGDINVASGGAITLASGSTITFSGTTSGLDNADIASRSRTVFLPAERFVLAADGVTPTTGDPARVVVSNVVVLEWAQGESAKVQSSFQVPADYASGATFTCLVKLDAASADTTLDWEIYVQAAAAAPDGATTNQTPAAVANDTTNIQAIALATATDTFAAGNVVYFNVWRAAGTGASSDLNLFGCYLTYTADM